MARSILQSQIDVADRVADRTLAARSADYADEVRRLIDGGRHVMIDAGDKRARVADIVAAAGLSNDAFYRHFSSKDDLVTAILEDGAQRLASYVAHQMDNADTPEAQLRAWVVGILSQAADEEVASATRAVLRNAQGLPDRSATTDTSALLALPVTAVLAELGSPQPALDAALAAHAVVGRMIDHLYRQTRPDDAEIDRTVAFVVGAAGPGAERRGP